MAAMRGEEGIQAFLSLSSPTFGTIHHESKFKQPLLFAAAATAAPDPTLSWQRGKPTGEQYTHKRDERHCQIKVGRSEEREREREKQ